jgi:hypothetical protein
MRALSRSVSASNTLVAAIFVSSAVFTSARASAQTCARPDAPAGYAGFAYGDAAATTFDGARARVHFVVTGPHAIDSASTGADGVPDVARRVVETADDALSRYETMGFRVPVPDGKPVCGDGPLVDVFLVAFNQADGLTATEACTPKGSARTCAGFVLVDSRLDLRYPSAEQGIRTVVPHELFHLVQNAYDANMSRFWAEGTAQWATAKLDPTLPDLASYVGSFLKEPDHALDGPVMGVTAGYLYGSALWPVFLGQTEGDAIVEEIFSAETDGTSALEAADVALKAHGSDLATAYGTFALWNVATGKRAGEGGYVDAAAYPLAPLRPFATTAGAGTVAETMSGLSSIPYRLDDLDEADLTLTADDARTRGFFAPLVDGRVVLASATALPTRTKGAGIAVIVGITKSKVDAPFVLSRTPVTVGAGGAGGAGGAAAAGGEAGSAGTTNGALPPPAAVPASSDGGCHLSPIAPSASPLLPLSLALSALAFTRRARRKVSLP